MSHLLSRQSGVALIVVLIVLVIMALLGATSLKGATLSEKMAGNLHNQQITFQAAEKALRYCEKTVLTYMQNPDHYQLDPAPIEADESSNDFAIDANWSDDSKTTEIAGIKDALHLERGPRCMIELVNDRTQLPATLRNFDDRPLLYPYRITVRAYGPTHTDSVISLQSYLRL